MNERRSFLKWAGLGLSLPLATKATAKAGTARGKPQWAMVIDLERCMGCESCVIACKSEKLTAKGRFNTRVLKTEQTVRGETRPFFQPLLCNHCDDAPCVKACKSSAVLRLESGIVVTDWSRCCGRGDCISACPHGARFLDDRYNRVDHCDFCLHRINAGIVPACVEACPSNARIFGDLSNPEGEFARYIRSGGLKSLGPKGARVLYRADKREKEPKQS